MNQWWKFVNSAYYWLLLFAIIFKEKSLSVILELLLPINFANDRKGEGNGKGTLRGVGGGGGGGGGARRRKM